MKKITIGINSDIPMYQQIYDQIVAQILNGHLKSGTNLPSIRTMAKELRVSVITIKKTWDKLEKSGYLTTISGKGTYITELSDKKIEKKKDVLLEELFRESIEQSRTLNITKEKIIKLIDDLYDS